MQELLAIFLLLYTKREAIYQLQILILKALYELRMLIQRVLSRTPSDGILGYKKSVFTTWEMNVRRPTFLSSTSASSVQLLGFAHDQKIRELLYNRTDVEENLADTVLCFMKSSKRL